MAMMLLHRNATVTMCHSRTKNLPDVVRFALWPDGESNRVAVTARDVCS